jgi:RNA polymerase sigma-70 factor, ECF subfamily
VSAERPAGPSGPEPVTGSSSGTWSSRRLLARAKGGDAPAMEALFQRLLSSLNRWAHGRLPPWARRGADTSDIVQEAVVHAFGRLRYFEPRHRHALRSYLRQAVRNRIKDEIRRAHVRGGIPLPVEESRLVESGTPYDSTLAHQEEDRYRRGLLSLAEGDQELIVARLELGYNYDQLALVSGRSSPDSARMAVKRALLRLAHAMDSA